MPDSPMTPDDQYALGRTQKEYARLARQSEILAPMTQRLFEDAGIQPGMRVLDLGSGAGDVCMLLSRIVGPQGTVIGIDMDAAAISHARERAASAGINNIEYVHSSIETFHPEQKVDAVVGRFVLLYQPDPAAALAAVVRHLRPDGIVAFLEPWFQKPNGPDSSIIRVITSIIETLRRSGAHLDIGPRLHRIFAAAGLPIPNMRCETIIDGHPDSPLYRYAADTLENILPKAIEFGLAAEGQFDFEKLPALMQGELQAFGYAMTIAPIMAAWSRSAG